MFAIVNNRQDVSRLASQCLGGTTPPNDIKIPWMFPALADSVATHTNVNSSEQRRTALIIVCERKDAKRLLYPKTNKHKILDPGWKLAEDRKAAANLVRTIATKQKERYTTLEVCVDKPLRIIRNLLSSAFPILVTSRAHFKSPDVMVLDFFLLYKTVAKHLVYYHKDYHYKKNKYPYDPSGKIHPTRSVCFTISADSPQVHSDFIPSPSITQSAPSVESKSVEYTLKSNGPHSKTILEHRIMLGHGDVVRFIASMEAIIRQKETERILSDRRLIESMINDNEDNSNSPPMATSAFLIELSKRISKIERCFEKWRRESRKALAVLRPDAVVSSPTSNPPNPYLGSSPVDRADSPPFDFGRE